MPRENNASKEAMALTLLKEFCEDIEATGGIKVNWNNEIVGLVVDEDWLDLAWLYDKACRLLGRSPKEEK
jgi:hypothetical protein